MMQYVKKDLEQVFANNFASPVFPILAEIYFQNKEYGRAFQVCKIGLSHNSDNEMGIYILSKIYLINKKYDKAEDFLKKIIKKNSHHSKALIDLAKVQIQLNRSKKNIQKTIDLGLEIGVKNEIFQFKSDNSINKREVQKPKNRKQKYDYPDSEHIYINKSMATKTMYRIMVKQKKYDVALSVLNTMKKESKYLRYVSKEIKKIKDLINQRN